MIRSLPVVLSDEDFRVKSSNLAEKLNDLEALDLESVESRKRFKERIEELEAEIGALARQVRERKEYRPVECVEQKDFAASTVLIVRLDTGEIVDARPMTADERQLEMFPRGVTEAAEKFIDSVREGETVTLSSNNRSVTIEGKKKRKQKEELYERTNNNAGARECL